jgi:hypothetical protein
MLPQPPLSEPRSRKGTALIVALALIMMLASMATVLMNEMHTRSHHVEVDLEDIKAFEAAEAGVDAAISDINRMRMLQLVTAGGTVLSPDGRPVRVHDPTIHTDDKGNNVKAGCLGTVNWNVPLGTDRKDDLLPINLPKGAYIPRPTWQSSAALDDAGDILYVNGQQVFHDPNIVPQQLGDVAFFTYAIDWLWDGLDNDGYARPGIIFGAGAGDGCSAEHPYSLQPSPYRNDGRDQNNNGKVDCAIVSDALEIKDVNEVDLGERNKYTIYSTGIHKGLLRDGATREGRVVTIEVVVQAGDVDLPLIDTGPLQLQVRPKWMPPP